MATMAFSEKVREIKQVKRVDKGKAIEMFFALIREHPFPVNTIVLHYAFHIEEVAAGVFYKKWGEKFFPGIADATVEIWGEGRMPQEYQEEGLSDLDLLLNKRTLIIGAANSLTDEHGSRFPSAAHLAIELLGLTGNPLFRQLLNFYENTDNRPNSTFFDFHSFIKRAHIYNKYINKGDEEKEDADMQELLSFLMKTVEVDLWDQLRFLECEEEFTSNASKFYKWVNPSCPKEKIEITCVRSDNHAMAKYTRKVFGRPPDVYVQQGSSGSTIVFFSPRLLDKLKLSGVDIRDFVRILRIAEMRKNGLTYNLESERWLSFNKYGVNLCLTWQDLEASLDSEFCPPWYHSAKGNQLLSRSLTAPEAPETMLNIQEIVQAIALALTPLIRPCKEDAAVDCKACKFYRLGFISCRSRRFENRTNGQKQEVLLATGTNGS